MKLLETQKKLKSGGFKVFSTLEFQQITGISPTGARKFLLHYTGRGVFWQLRRGLYALRDDSLTPWLVANKLYRPSYISLETVLSHYGFIPESIYGITSVTTRITREFESCEQLFLYHSIKQSAYTGYQPLAVSGGTDVVLVAEPEKALADYFYFVHLGKKKLNDRLRLRKIQKQKLWNYLKLFERKNLLSWSRHVITEKL